MTIATIERNSTTTTTNHKQDHALELVAADEICPFHPVRRGGRQLVAGSQGAAT